MKSNIKIAESISEWVHLAAQIIVSEAAKAIQNRDIFSLVLSGGRTPEPVYEKLASKSIQNAINWEKTFIFWGDERCVPPNHKDSNYRMARKSLLDHITIPPENIFRMEGEYPPQEAAQAYEQIIENFFLNKIKRFDTILLGLGEDGHIASLFPGTVGLQEKNRWVIPNQNPVTKSPRITLTFPAINNSRNIIFLVKGKEKSEIIEDVINHPHVPPYYPAKGITGKETPPNWILEKSAAEKLSQKNH